VMENYTHVIVGGPRLNEENIIYRRRRLLEYLAKKQTASAVYWVYFKPGPIYKIGKLSYPKLPKKYEKYPYNKIKQIEISDFKFLLSFITFFQSFLVGKILNEFKGEGKKILWFTLHRFAKLSEIDIWSNLIYDCSDNWTNKDEKGLMKKILDYITSKSEKRIVRNTRIHTASAPFLKNKIELMSSRECYLIEHGYNPTMFDDLIKPAVENDNNKFCFIGGLQGNKVDSELLLSIAKSRPEWEFWIIGPFPAEKNKDSTYKQLEKLENVYLKGPVAPDLIPMQLRTMNVGLLPYKNTEFAKGVFPLKFYEYLAANLNVVGCNLSSLRKYANNGVYMESSDRVDEFIEKCEIALKTDPPSELIKESLKHATWEKRFDEMYSKATEELN